jgi:D-alanine-D-alanine ligase
MTQKPLIAVVFNEPTVATVEGRKFISEGGQLGAMAARADVISTMAPGTVDLSEVGVIEAREHVEQALRAEGYQTTLLNINGDLKQLIDFLKNAKPDIVFNLCEGVRNLAIHEMHIAGIFELMNVPYTGAGSFALGAALNKARTKEILTYHGIPTARFAMFKSLADFDAATLTLRFPMIVKPSREDASIGIENNSVVRNAESLRARVKIVIELHLQPALVEEYIEGRELNVAIMGTEHPVSLPISEIDFSGLPDEYPKIVTYNAKWVEGSKEFVGTVGTCPAKLDPAIEGRVRQIALRAYQVMEIRDFGRVDIRLHGDGTPYVLEVNPNPDISEDAGFARSARTHGMTYSRMIGAIVEYALARTGKPEYAYPKI